MFRVKRGLCVFDVHVEEGKVYIYPADGTRGDQVLVKAILKSEQTLSHIYISSLTNGDGEDGLISYYKKRNWQVVRLVPVLKINGQGQVHTVYVEEEDP